jgi:PleD family two-component response regulator
MRILTAAARESASGKDRFKWASVLVADDDADNRHIARRSIAPSVNEVFEAANGRVALELLQTREIDLVVLDLVMPEVDGYGVLQAMRGDARLRNIQVIVHSSLDDSETILKSVTMGADDFLPKPCHHVLLLIRVQASLEKKWLRDQLGARL